MQTVNDVVKAVLANPNAYTNAFPVSSAPEREALASEHMYVYPTSFFGLDYSRQVLQRMADLTSHVSDFGGGLPGAPSDEAGGAQLTPEVLDAARARLRSTPLRQDSVISRIMSGSDRAVWGRGLDSPASLQNGEPASNEVCTRCGRPRLCVQRRRSTVNPRVHYRGLGDPDPFVAVCGECVEIGCQLPRFVDGNTHWVLDDTLPPDGLPQFMDNRAHYMTILDEARRSFDRSSEVLQQQAGPHTRTAPGQCACGFTSMFTEDMDRHVEGR